MRTGNEPLSARSPLRARLALIVFGLLWAVGALTGFVETGHPGWAAVFGVIAGLALVDLTVVVHRIRQGPHYQPGRDIPPYRPADPGERPPRRDPRREPPYR